MTFSKFFDRFDKSLISGLTVLVGICLGFIYWRFPPDKKVPMWLFVLTVIMFYLVCLIIYAVCLKTREDMNGVPYRSLTVKRIGIRVDQRGMKTITFIVEQNSFFSCGHYVAIDYQSKDNTEAELGIGYVDRIIDNGDIQIKFQKPFPEASEFIGHLKDTISYRGAVKIKPSFSAIHVQLLKDDDFNM